MCLGRVLFPRANLSLAEVTLTIMKSECQNPVLWWVDGLLSAGTHFLLVISTSLLILKQQ